MTETLTMDASELGIPPGQHPGGVVRIGQVAYWFLHADRPKGETVGWRYRSADGVILIIAND